MICCPVIFGLVYVFSRQKFILVFMAQKLYLMNDNEWCVVLNSEYRGHFFLGKLSPVWTIIYMILWPFKTCPSKCTYLNDIVSLPNFVVNKTGYIA